MREETKPWLEKADENLDTAEYMFKGARYAPACFMCQQALEVLLKAAIVELAGKRHPKIHTLVKLAREAGLELSSEQDLILKEISRHYFQVRYPDMVRAKYNRQIAEETLTQTKELYRWIKEKIIKK